MDQDTKKQAEQLGQMIQKIKENCDKIKNSNIDNDKLMSDLKEKQKNEKHEKLLSNSKEKKMMR